MMNCIHQSLRIFFLFMAFGAGWCFVAPSTVKEGVKPTMLMAKPDFIRNAAPMAASALAAAFIFSSVATTIAPAFAASMNDNNYNYEPSSSQVIAARSGGRMGGRSSMGSRSSSTTNIRRTTIVRPAMSSPSVIVAPPMYSPFGFSPFGGFGT